MAGNRSFLNECAVALLVVIVLKVILLL